MSTKTQIFIIGATGYIGGAILERLLQYPTASNSKITALVRDPAKVSLFASIGVKSLDTVVGSNDDGALLERQASESDVVFTCADADHAGACETILRGLKKRHEATGTVSVLIHTSGTGVLIKDAKGMYTHDTIWDDRNPDQLETLPDTQIHRDIDLLILAADKEGYARTHIVLPSTVYGFATGRLVTLGIQNPRSIQIPMLVTESIRRKRAGIVGLGLNIWPNVHVNDLCDLYVVLYDAILDSRAGHGREGLYFGENGEHVLIDKSERIGEVLVALGVSSPDERTPTSFDEAAFLRPQNKYLVYVGAHSRCQANERVRWDGNPDTRLRTC